MWDVRIRGSRVIPGIGQVYDRRRDVDGALIPERVAQMVVAAEVRLTFEQASALTYSDALRHLHDLVTRPGRMVLNPAHCIRCHFITGRAGDPDEAVYTRVDGELRGIHKHSCPAPLSAREVAAAAKVGTSTRRGRYRLYDEDGMEIERTCTDSTSKVLLALSRHDWNRMEAGPRKRRCATVAYALRKCIDTGRMPPETSLRIQNYRPWQVCALVARIARDCPEAEIGGICDVWLIDNHTTL